MAFFKSLLCIIISGGASYTLFRVTSVKEEDFIKNLPEGQKLQKVDRKRQEQILKVLKRAARVPEPMSLQDQDNASSTSSKLKKNISGTEK